MRFSRSQSLIDYLSALRLLLDGLWKGLLTRLRLLLLWIESLINGGCCQAGCNLSKTKMYVPMHEFARFPFHSQVPTAPPILLLEREMVSQNTTGSTAARLRDVYVDHFDIDHASLAACEDPNPFYVNVAPVGVISAPLHA